MTGADQFAIGIFLIWSIQFIVLTSQILVLMGRRSPRVARLSDVIGLPEEAATAESGGGSDGS